MTLCFVLFEKSELEDALDASALSPSLLFLLRPECDELDAAEEGRGGGSIAAAGGG
jgi:hypothetical protein